MNFFFPEKAQSFRNIDFRSVNQYWLEQQSVFWDNHWKNYCHSGGFPKFLSEFHNKNEILDPSFRVYQDWIKETWSKVRTSESSLSALSQRICDTLNSRISMESLRKGTDILSANTI